MYYDESVSRQDYSPVATSIPAPTRRGFFSPCTWGAAPAERPTLATRSSSDRDSGHKKALRTITWIGGPYQSVKRGVANAPDYFPTVKGAGRTSYIGCSARTTDAAMRSGRVTTGFMVVHVPILHSCICKGGRRQRFAGNPATVAFVCRPEALRPHFSMGLPIINELLIDAF